MIDKGTPYGVKKLNGELSESANKRRFFTNVCGARTEHLSYPEAVRWLLYVNAFDDTSAKPSIRGAGLPSTGAGWLGKLGLIYAKGHNLFETLLLNLVLLDDQGMPFPEEQAVWELAAPRTQERVEIPTPQSPLAMLTLQSRRVLLQRDEAGVTGYLLLGGDFFPKENALAEQMTVWRQNDDGSWVPRRHDPSRTMWRDYSVMIAKSDKGRQPGVVRWVAYLEMHQALPINAITFGIAGVKYGDKDFFVDDLIEDSLSLNADLLAAVGDEWSTRISEVIERTDQCVQALGLFVINVAELSGNDSKDSRKAMADTVRSEAYYQLDQPFRNWLMVIDPEKSDMELMMNDWLAQVGQIIFADGKKILQNANEKAFVGKSMVDNSVTKYRIFRFTVNKILRGE